jgi:hypothetical protein
MKVKSDNKVIHPDKVYDVDLLLRKLMCKDKLIGQAPVYIFMGAGTKESYFRNYTHDRELHRLVSWFTLKNWPLKNIIAIDIDNNICDTWNQIGIKCFNANWQDVFYMKNTIIPYIDSIVEKNGSRRIVYANTHGSREDVSFYEQWLQIFRPSYFLGLYSMRQAFNYKAIVKHIKSLQKYKPLDLGLLSKTNKPGLIGYQGLAMSVLERK